VSEESSGRILATQVIFLIHQAFFKIPIPQNNVKKSSRRLHGLTVIVNIVNKVNCLYFSYHPDYQQLIYLIFIFFISSPLKNTLLLLPIFHCQNPKK
jgi:hypothetical protein